MSVIGEILQSIEEKVNELIPSYKQMPFVYNLELNDRLQEKNYAIQLGNANTINGTNRAVTFDHNIDLILCQKYSPKKGYGDKDLRDKIAEISGDLELVYKELYRRPLSIPSASLLVIAPLDLSAPDIDNDNNLVTISLTLAVKYRVAT